MPFTFDATLKEVVQHYPNEYSERFGLPSQQAMPLNVDLSTLSAATDVALGFGDPLEEIADLNFQSGSDPFLAQRGLLYNAALGHRFHVPVRSLFILLRPAADHRNLNGILAYNVPAFRVEFRYEVVRLWQQTAESFEQGSAGLLPLAVLGELPRKAPEDQELRELVLRIEARLRIEVPHVEAVRLMTAAFILSGLRVARHNISSIFQGVGLMHESSAYQLVLEEGIEKGIEKGIQRGESRGKQNVILRQGKIRFGSAAPPHCQAAIQSISDLDQLDRLADAILTTTSWEDLLAVS